LTSGLTIWRLEDIVRGNEKKVKQVGNDAWPWMEHPFGLV
jgi:hypothetical protein